MPNPDRAAVLLGFDGVVHTSDLPVQSFARHLTESLATAQSQPIIAGMRGFLEAKPDLLPPGIDLTTAEDGYQAVEILARAAGLGTESIARAYQASRSDLATSAWAVDEADGLGALLTALKGAAHISVLTEPNDPAAAEVLDSIEVTVNEVIAQPITAAIDAVLCRLDTPDPERLMVIGARWAGQLSVAHDIGCATAMIDRYGHDFGAPTFRSRDLEGLPEKVRTWMTSAPA